MDNDFGNVTITTTTPWQDTTTSSNWITITPYYPYTYPYVTVAPTECVGDCHVFPCPHCCTCKCGQATVKRKKAR